MSEAHVKPVRFLQVEPMLAVGKRVWLRDCSKTMNMCQHIAIKEQRTIDQESDTLPTAPPMTPFITSYFFNKNLIILKIKNI